MFDGHRDDASYWTNFRPKPARAESMLLRRLVTDRKLADAMLGFGLRPLSGRDFRPYDPPPFSSKPWEPKAADLMPGELGGALIDLATGWWVAYDARSGHLRFIADDSSEVFGGVAMLRRAASFRSPLRFEQPRVPAFVDGRRREVPLTQPLVLSAASRAELDRHLASLADLFCGKCGASRLWFRGQREEFTLQRESDLTAAIYGRPHLPSLLPSLGRYAMKKPDAMGYSFAFAGPNHKWKKPFLIWMMRENRHWFEADMRCLDRLDQVLTDDDDQRFVRLMMQLQMGSFDIREGSDLAWPDEADDLRQWFFAFMKRFEFGVTLQQYGYCSSLLDVTSDPEVALYFSHARQMLDGKIRKCPPQPGRILYVFAEPPDGTFFRHGVDLFWGNTDWAQRLPPRLARQKAGFVFGSTDRRQNLYGMLIVARIMLDPGVGEAAIEDADLFPPMKDDLLYATLAQSRPVVEGLY